MVDMPHPLLIILLVRLPLSRRLDGHRAALTSICIVKNTPQLAVTADADGIFKLWGIGQTGMGSAPCLSTFQAGALNKFIPRYQQHPCSFVVVGHVLTAPHAGP